jgi:menaquinone-dependent protoporphyrinogen oxidase
MKVLVVYGTKSGCTTAVAERIAETLSAKGATVEVAAADIAGVAGGYDVVVVGSGVRAGQWHEAARTWVAANAEALKAIPVAFFTCGLMIAKGSEKEAEVRAYTDAVIENTGVKPVDIGLFAGWFEPEKFGFAERTILKVMKTPPGDYRDLAVITAWAEKTAGLLGISA